MITVLYQFHISTTKIRVQQTCSYDPHLENVALLIKHFISCDTMKMCNILTIGCVSFGSRYRMLFILWFHSYCQFLLKIAAVLIFEKNPDSVFFFLKKKRYIHKLCIDWKFAATWVYFGLQLNAIASHSKLRITCHEQIAGNSSSKKSGKSTRNAKHTYESHEKGMSWSLNLCFRAPKFLYMLCCLGWFFGGKKRA